MSLDVNFLISDMKIFQSVALSTEIYSERSFSPTHFDAHGQTGFPSS